MTRSTGTHLRRRDLIRGTGLLGAGLLLTTLAACNQQPSAPAPTAVPAKPTALPAKPTAGAATKPAATQAPAKPQTMQTARIATIANVAEYAFVYLGELQNIYRDQGLNVEFVQITDGGTQLKAMLAGEVDLSLGGAGSAFPAQEKGAEITLVGGAFPKLNFVMYAQPGINNVKELEGKSVGAASTGSFLHIIASALLREKGVDTSKVQFVNIGSSPAVFQAVEAAKVDAGPSSIDFIPRAREAGNPVVIADFSKEMPNYLRVVMIAQNRDIKDRPSYVQAMVNAVTLSSRYGLDHQDAVVKYGVEQMGKDKGAMEFLWEYDYENRIVAADAELVQQAVEYTQRVNVEAGTQKVVLPFDETSTLTFQKAFVDKFGKYAWK